MDRKTLIGLKVFVFVVLFCTVPSPIYMTVSFSGLPCVLWLFSVNNFFGTQQILIFLLLQLCVYITVFATISHYIICWVQPLSSLQRFLCLMLGLGLIVIIVFYVPIYWGFGIGDIRFHSTLKELIVK